MSLPPAAGSPYRIEVVCLGNICRSPMADVVLNRQLVAADLNVQVSSSGTGDWHLGEPMDSRAAKVLTDAGYDPTAHRAQQFSPGSEPDLILAMDQSNLADILAQLPPARHDRVRLFRTFDPEAQTANEEVPDPWYGGPDSFDQVLAMIERTTRSIVIELAGAGQ